MLYIRLSRTEQICNNGEFHKQQLYEDKYQSFLQIILNHQVFFASGKMNERVIKYFKIILRSKSQEASAMNFPKRGHLARFSET